MKFKNIITLFLIIFLVQNIISAQELLINQGFKSEDGLWCFPLASDNTQYLYLPLDGRLAKNEKDSLPKFSYMRYIIEKPSEEASSSAINNADGGGILHMLVLYDTPKEIVENAQSELRKLYDNKEITITGPVVFKKARYAVISSIISEDNLRKNSLLTTGEAPVLEGSKIALSFELDPVKSKLLLESFKMATSDVSIVFELTFGGLSDNFEAIMTVNWDEFRNSQSFGGKANVYIVSAEVEAGFDKLRKNNHIQLDIKGSNTKMEALIQVVYEKLMKLVFEPILPEEATQQDDSRAEDALTSAITGLFDTDGALGSGNTLGFGISAFYKQKDFEFEGTGTMEFTGRFPLDRNHFITFNLGNMFDLYGNDERVFKDVPLYDPAFKQRDIFVGIDGALEREFEKMVEGVTVWMKKTHANGTETIKDVFINKKKFIETEGRLPMSYLNHDDVDMTEWLNYDYKTIWKFTGGATYESEWKKESSSMINLHVPFKRKAIELEGDINDLTQQDIKVTKVKIEYDFFGETKTHDVKIREGDNLSEKSFEITLPTNQEEINYTITWFKKDGSRLEKKGVDKYGLIFIDDTSE